MFAPLVSVPVHRTICVPRVMSHDRRVPALRRLRASSCAGVRAVQVRSARSPCSGASTTIRLIRSGSTISTRIGPTAVAVRSSGIRPEAKTERCTSACTTLNAASITPRLGYRPRATAKKKSSVYPLNQNRSYWSGWPRPACARGSEVWWTG